VDERIQRGREYFRIDFTRGFQFYVEHVQSVLHKTTANNPIAILLGNYIHMYSTRNIHNYNVSNDTLKLYSEFVLFLVTLANSARYTHCLFFLRYALFSRSSFSKVNRNPSLMITPTMVSTCKVKIVCNDFQGIRVYKTVITIKQ